MFIQREVRAALVVSAFWGVLHGLIGAVLGAWFVVRMGAHQLHNLPIAMWSYALHSVVPGFLAGLAFCALLNRFERGSRVGTLSIARAIAWGIVASLSVFSILMYGVLPGLARQLLTAATLRSALAGAVAAALTIAIARRNRPPPALQNAASVSRILSSGRFARFWSAILPEKDVAEFASPDAHHALLRTATIWARPRRLVLRSVVFA